jgi:hypothetical protein
MAEQTGDVWAVLAKQAADIIALQVFASLIFKTHPSPGELLGAMENLRKGMLFQSSDENLEAGRPPHVAHWANERLDAAFLELMAKLSEPYG